MRILLSILIASIALTGCVSQKKYAELQAENERLKAEAPAAQARNEAEAVEIAAKLDQIRQLEMQVKTLTENEKEIHKMIEAGKLPQPTAEQMRMYEMEKMKELAPPPAPGEDPMMHEQQRSDLSIQFEQTAFEYRMVTKAMQASLKGYTSEQLDYDPNGGRSVVCIANKELFEAGSTELSDIGKALVGKMAVSLRGQAPLYYRIVGVTDGDAPADLAKANQRANAVYAQLKKEGAQVRMPISVGSSSCKNAAGNTKMKCDRVEIIFEQNYEPIMGQVEGMLAPR